MTVYVGTSGWQYKDWRGAFYPDKLPQRDWLPHFAARFGVVEVNNTFYNLPRAEVFTAWRERTPADFRFALKMSRYLTHLKRLKEPREPIDRFLKAASGLGEKMGPLLLQLPPNMKAEAGRLDEALVACPAGVRIAVEFRDASWYTDSIREVLSRHGAALCLADRGEKPITPEWRTAGWGYVRFHWGAGEPGPCYTDGCLREWARRIAGLWDGSCDVYAFFNNDPRCCAVSDARRLALEIKHLGLNATRVPESEDVHIWRD